uniref:Uncharacterized protein n=1 Tax=Rhizophora mucronata TaxID=61149 RepID=A0A2P2NZQ8_RHIMU
MMALLLDSSRADCPVAFLKILSPQMILLGSTSRAESLHQGCLKLLLVKQWRLVKLVCSRMEGI